MNTRTMMNLVIAMMIVTVLASSCQEAVSFVDEFASEFTDEGEEGLLTASGTIQADEVRVASELGGRILEVRVEVGTGVQAGDELVVLDATPILTKLAEAEAAIVAAQADLAVVKAGPRSEEVAAARAALALAEAGRDGDLAAWENALGAIEDPQELDAQIAGARTSVELAAQGVELAEAELAREKLVRDQKPEGSMERRIADLQVRAAEETLAAAQADEKAAQTMLNWLWLIRSEPLGLIAQAHAAEGQYRMAEEGVAVAQARLDDLLAGPTPEEVAVAEAAVRQAQAQADVLRVQQAKFTLTSPVDGVVLDQNLRRGELAAPAATVLTVADLREVTLMAYVPENRIGQVQLGQAVQVSVDSFPGQSFAGQVTRIGDEPEFTPRNVATQEERLNTFYAVEVRLPNAEGLLKPGMPADATF
jgi:HlyD family secretion protein